MIWRTDYAAHAEFVAPARARAQVWRLIVGFMLAAFAYVALSRLYFQIVLGLSGGDAPALLQELDRGQTPRSILILLFSFAFMALGTGIAVRILHRRPMRSLLGPLPRLFRDFRAVLVVLLLLGVAIALLPPWGMDEPFTRNLAFGTWLLLLPLSLLAVLVQVSAEEIVFRGYVQQQLAARFKSPLIWMVLPSILFAAGHYLPEMTGDNALLIAIWAGVFGILMADLTARSGSLGPAIAVHFWNNASAMLIVSLPDELSGLALYHTPFTMSDTATMRGWLWVDLCMILVLWLAARLAIRR